jgi:hypothetical protein
LAGIGAWFDTVQSRTRNRCQSTRKAGERVSIREVAAQAGVTVATVSNVINRPEIVAAPTRDRVLAAIMELGFVRNESARQLRARRSRTIGLVVLDVANPFFTDVARGVEDEANKAGLTVILGNSDDHAREENRYLDVLEEHRVHGVLITPVVGVHPAGEPAKARHPGCPGRQEVPVPGPALGRGRRPHAHRDRRAERVRRAAGRRVDRRDATSTATAR